MNNFIKLTTRVINKSHIIEIVKCPNTYYLHMSSSSMSGFWTAMFGNISGSNNMIHICEEKHKQDYDIITDFIKEIK